MTTIAYLDCIGGLAGDMLLAALLDAGAPHEVLHDAVRALGLDDVKVEVSRTERHGIAATHVEVIEDAAPAERRAGALIEAVARADLAPQVAAAALDALDRLIRAESTIHSVTSDDLVVHEAGGSDTLIDIVGVFALLDALGVERVVCSPIPYARALIGTRHGTIPGPGPAVLALLEGALLTGVDAEAELVTPTGAAIVATVATSFGELPPMRLGAVGYGAGARDLRLRPNLLRLVLGTEHAPLAHTDVALLATSLDDLLPELVPDVVDACRAAGALDVWIAPVQMKKGRPGVEITAVTRLEAEQAVARALLTHTTTLGVRVAHARRYELERAFREVEVDGHRVRVKLGVLDGRVVNAVPEHDDCASVAALTGRPVKQVWADALTAARGFEGRSLDPDSR
jgi:pyridinium-3,5-bisthiocarboxylic acid mononucleotide nickel chelatase